MAYLCRASRPRNGGARLRTPRKNTSPHGCLGHERRQRSWNAIDAKLQGPGAIPGAAHVPALGDQRLGHRTWNRRRTLAFGTHHTKALATRGRGCIASLCGAPTQPPGQLALAHSRCDSLDIGGHATLIARHGGILQRRLQKQTTLLQRPIGWDQGRQRTGRQPCTNSRASCRVCHLRRKRSLTCCALRHYTLRRCTLCLYSLCLYSLCRYSLCLYSLCRYSLCRYSLCRCTLRRCTLCRYTLRRCTLRRCTRHRCRPLPGKQPALRHSLCGNVARRWFGREWIFGCHLRYQGLGRAAIAQSGEQGHKPTRCSAPLRIGQRILGLSSRLAPVGVGDLLTLGTCHACLFHFTSPGPLGAVERLAVLQRSPLIGLLLFSSHLCLQGIALALFHQLFQTGQAQFRLQQ